MAGVAASATSDKDLEEEKEIEEVCKMSLQCGYHPSLDDRYQLNLLTSAQRRVVRNSFRHIHGESEQTAREMFLSALQMGRRARKEDFLDTCNAVS